MASKRAAATDAVVHGPSSPAAPATPARTARRGRAATPVSAPDPRLIAENCDPASCPCEDAECSLSRYVRSVQAANGEPLRGERTLEATEVAVAERLRGMQIDMGAMAAVANIYRAASAVRNHLERTVLAPHDLTWTAWVVLWVVWIWGDIESRHVAAEAGISKGTLTGVANTLIGRGLLDRRVHPEDARRVLLSLTPKGRRLMTSLFPRFNAVEVEVTGGLDADEQLQLARALRSVVKRSEQG